jgi:shikimate dehydrogenase
MGPAGALKYLVVGFPVGHSLSPAMMNAAFRSRGLPAEYAAREILPEDWPGAMPALHAEGIEGINVTVPHKEAALAGARSVSPEARAIGAANTLIRTPNGWLAHNTDGPGLRAWIEELGAAEAAQQEALVIGAGGSARAVVWALGELGCPRVRIANRTAQRAEKLARQFGATTRITVEAPGGPAPAGGICVQCTSLGLRAEDPLPAEPALLREAALVLDLVYPDTPLVRAVREAGGRAENGLGLLVHQGRLSFERWTGQLPDAEEMAAACGEELRRRGRAG